MSLNPLNLDPILAAPLGTQEIVVIVVLIFLLFGAKKIPELMRSLGRAQGEYQHAKKQFEKELKTGEGGDEAKATAAAASPSSTATYTPATDLATAQVKAKELGIDPVGKNLQTLNEEIAEKTGGPTG